MKKAIAFALVVLFLFGACKKRRLNRDTTTAIDVSMIEGAFNDVQKNVEDAVKRESLEGQKSTKDIYGNPTITVNPAWPDTTFPKMIRIDYGTGTTDLSGRTRRGVINVTATGFYRDSGAVFTAVPSGFYIENHAISGTKTIVNKGRNSTGNLYYGVEVVNGKVITPDGDKIMWNSSRTREWIGGENTTFLTGGVNGILDDTYSITGTATGVNRLDRGYIITIQEALIVSQDCRWIKDGKFELIPEDLDTRIVDYGSGSCDNDAVVEIANRSYNIEMW